MKHAQHEIKILLLLLLNCQTISRNFVITSHWLQFRCYKNQETMNQDFKYCSDIHKKMFKIFIMVAFMRAFTGQLSNLVKFFQIDCSEELA